MGTGDVVSLQVSPSVVKEIVQTQVATEVVKALEGKEGLIERMVTEALSFRVNSEGKISSYNSDNKYSWVDVMVGAAVREVAKQSVMDFIAKSKDKIESAVQAELKKQTKGIVAAFMNCILESAKNSYNIKVDVKAQERY